MRSKPNTQPLDWTIWLQSQRRLAVTILLRFIVILGAIGLLFSLQQVILHGRIGLNFIYFSLSYIATLALYFNKRISDEWRGAGFLLVMTIFASLAYYSGWLASGGRVIWLAAVVVASILIGPRWGLFTALAAMLVYLAFAFLYGFGWLTLRPLPEPTTLVPIFIEGVGFAMMLSVVVAGQWLFGQALRAAAESNRAAQESRDSFSSIVERSADGMIVVDEAYTVRFINNAAQVFSGQSKSDIQGKLFPRIAQLFDGAEVDICQADGSAGVAELRITLTEWEGAPARLVVLRDITERKRAGLALSKSEEKFNRAFHASPVAMALSSMETGFVDVNQALCEMTGYARDEFLGRFGSDLNLWVDPAAYEQLSQHFLRDGAVKNHELHFRRKNGQVCVGLVSSERIEMDGNPSTIFSIIDITDLKNADEAVLTANQMLSNYATELETLTNRLILAARVSRSASELLDPNHLSEQVVKTIQNEFGLYYVGLFLCDENRQWADLRAATGVAGQALLAEKHRLPIDETSMIGWSIKYCAPRIALDVGAEAVRFDNPLLPETRSELALPLISRNEVIGAVSVQSAEESAFTEANITWMQNLADLLANALSNARLYNQLQKELRERQLAELQVRKLNEELEERVRQRTAQLEATNKELEAFSYSVSHDLRAPLRSVDGFSRILADDFSSQLPEDAQRYVRIIRESAQKMGQLIEDILRLSRLSRAELRTETFDVSIYAHEIMQRLQADSPERQARFTLRAPLVVTADRNLLVIVLENLLNNAWKFTAQKQMSEITLDMLEQKGCPVIFVRDNGVGFDMSHAQKLFGAFQRLHSDQDFPGTGIGLAMVQRIINRHGGRIWAESEAGKGTTFFFTLSE